MVEQKNKRVLIGKVVSKKTDKSAIVEIENRIKHPVYGKYVKRNKRFAIHDPNNSCHDGDLVSIQECRPISKTKHFMLIDILEKAQD